MTINWFAWLSCKHVIIQNFVMSRKTTAVVREICWERSNPIVCFLAYNKNLLFSHTDSYLSKGVLYKARVFNFITIVTIIIYIILIISEIFSFLHLYCCMLVCHYYLCNFQFHYCYYYYFLYDLNSVTSLSLTLSWNNFFFAKKKHSQYHHTCYI